MMAELKPCPFCGSEAEIFKDVSFKAETGETIGEIKCFVWCTKCTALVSGNTEEETIEAWNWREEPRHGTWVEIPLEPFAPRYECSECGHEPAVEYGEWVLSDYCPHCGAKMDISEGGETSGEEA